MEKFKKLNRDEMKNVMGGLVGPGPGGPGGTGAGGYRCSSETIKGECYWYDSKPSCAKPYILETCNTNSQI